jgi:hypothetical protein
MALDRDTVVRLLMRERTKILGFVYSMLRDHQAAEDVLQDLSVLAIDRCAEIAGRGALPGLGAQGGALQDAQGAPAAARAAVGLDEEVLDSWRATGTGWTRSRRATWWTPCAAASTG